MVQVTAGRSAPPLPHPIINLSPTHAWRDQEATSRWFTPFRRRAIQHACMHGFSRMTPYITPMHKLRTSSSKKVLQRRSSNIVLFAKLPSAKMPITINGAMTGKFNVAETMGTVHNDVLYQGRQPKILSHSSLPTHSHILFIQITTTISRRSEPCLLDNRHNSNSQALSLAVN